MGNKQTNLATLAIAINFALSEGKEPPEWIELVPAGEFVGRDGRDFDNPDPQAVVDFIINRGVDIPIDEEHSTEIKAPKGESAPARSWIKAQAKNFEIRKGALWAKPDWKQRGIDIIQNEEYRYYSPAFYIKEGSNVVAGVKSIGFTNTPNLSLTALNHEGETTMGLSKAIAAALGLEANASESDAVLAITKLKEEHQLSLNQAQNPPTDKFVPKATYDLAINRAEQAEQKLKERAEQELELAINTEVDAAVKAGKIAPADKDYYISTCQQEGGLDKFKAFVAKKAPIVDGRSQLDGKELDGESVSLNAEERLVAEQLGISVEDFQAAKKEKS